MQMCVVKHTLFSANRPVSGCETGVWVCVHMALIPYVFLYKYEMRTEKGGRELNILRGVSPTFYVKPARKRRSVHSGSMKLVPSFIASGHSKPQWAASRASHAFRERCYTDLAEIQRPGKD